MLSTYTELKLQVLNYSHRPDLVDDLEIILVLAETMIDKDVRVREMEKREVILVDDIFIDLPEDYLEMRAMHILAAGKRLPIPQLTPQQLDYRYNNATGKPQAYAIHAGQMEIRPGVINTGSPLITYDLELSYFARVETLETALLGTNEILRKYPMIYLSAMLIQLYLLIQDDDEQVRWTQQYQSAVSVANGVSQKGRYNVPSVSNIG